MIRLALPALLILAACTSPTGQSPLTGLLGQGLGDPALTQRRGAVEVLVKTNHAAMVQEILAGGGPLLTQAMDAAGVPPADRPARLIQLNGDAGLYSANPGALITALMVYGG